MNTPHEKMANALNIASGEIESLEIKGGREIIEPEIVDDKNTGISLPAEDIKTDYEKNRDVLYDLIQQGQDALHQMSLLSQQIGTPRSYEVQAILIKTIAETAKGLIDLQNDTRKIDSISKSSKGDTNNYLFVTTAELQKYIKETQNESDEESEEQVS